MYLISYPCCRWMFCLWLSDAQHCKLSAQRTVFKLYSAELVFLCFCPWLKQMLIWNRNQSTFFSAMTTCWSEVLHKKSLKIENKNLQLIVNEFCLKVLFVVLCMSVRDKTQYPCFSYGIISVAVMSTCNWKSHLSLYRRGYSVFRELWKVNVIFSFCNSHFTVFRKYRPLPLIDCI